MRSAPFFLFFLAILCVPRQASANIAVLLEEPYGYDGAFAGTGHAAVYLSRVCAASPILLRRCKSGERGVVISRYNRVGGYDWIAIPLIPYLYAVTKPEDIPVYADAGIVTFLRNQYRRENLKDIAPEDPSGMSRDANWEQLVGSAYNRTSFAYEIETTPGQDDELIHWLNSRPNRALYKVLSRNCADFVRELVNFYYPKTVSRSIVADLGMTTPKRTAKALAKYSQRHPDLEFTSIVIPQVPGAMRRSRPVRGIVESVFRAKKYVIPLAVLQPYVAGGFASAYVVAGRFKPERNAMIFNLGGPALAPLTPDERATYQKELNEMPRNDSKDGSSHQDARWQEFRAKAQLRTDENGQLILQGYFGDHMAGIGISRNNFLNGDAPFELQRELLINHLRYMLEGGSVPKVSGVNLRDDWQLLQRVISNHNGQEGPAGRAESGKLLSMGRSD